MPCAAYCFCCAPGELLQRCAFASFTDCAAYFWSCAACCFNVLSSVLLQLLQFHMRDTCVGVECSMALLIRPKCQSQTQVSYVIPDRHSHVHVPMLGHMLRISFMRVSHQLCNVLRPGCMLPAVWCLLAVCRPVPCAAHCVFAAMPAVLCLSCIPS